MGMGKTQFSGDSLLRGAHPPWGFLQVPEAFCHPLLWALHPSPAGRHTHTQPGHSAESRGASTVDQAIVFSARLPQTWLFQLPSQIWGLKWKMPEPWSQKTN